MLQSIVAQTVELTIIVAAGLLAAHSIGQMAVWHRERCGRVHVCCPDIEACFQQREVLCPVLSSRIFGVSIAMYNGVYGMEACAPCWPRLMGRRLGVGLWGEGFVISLHAKLAGDYVYEGTTLINLVEQGGGLCYNRNVHASYACVICNAKDYHRHLRRHAHACVFCASFGRACNTWHVARAGYNV